MTEIAGAARTEHVLVRPGSEYLVTCLDEPAEPPVGVAVLIHGLTSDMMGPAGQLRLLAERMSVEGIAVIRFDARGCGELFLGAAIPDRDLDGRRRDVDIELRDVRPPKRPSADPLRHEPRWARRCERRPRRRRSCRRHIDIE